MEKSKILSISFLFLFIIFFSGFWKFYPLYLFETNELFTDWNYILEYYNCLNKKIVSELRCNDILKYDFVYPKIWFEIVDLTNYYFKYLIILFIFVYVLIIYQVLSNYNIAYYFLFLFSPTSILLIQRGNNEILIFLLIFFLVKFIRIINFRYFSLFSYTIASLLKIYPISLLFFFYFCLPKKDIFLKIFVSFIFIIIIYLYFDLSLSINKNHNPGKVTLIYGADSIFHIFNIIFKQINLNTTFFSITSFLILIISVLPIKMKDFEINVFNSDLFFAGSVILVLSFFFNASFDYRFIYILFTLPFFIELKNNNSFFYIKYLIYMIFGVLWIEFLIFYIIDFTDFNQIRAKHGNILNFYTIFVGTIIGIKNLSYWLINLFLIIFLKKLVIKKFIN